MAVLYTSAFFPISWNIGISPPSSGAACHLSRGHYVLQLGQELGIRDARSRFKIFAASHGEIESDAGGGETEGQGANAREALFLSQVRLREGLQSKPGTASDIPGVH